MGGFPAESKVFLVVSICVCNTSCDRMSDLLTSTIVFSTRDETFFSKNLSSDSVIGSLASVINTATSAYGRAMAVRLA